MNKTYPSPFRLSNRTNFVDGAAQIAHILPIIPPGIPPVFGENEDQTMAKRQHHPAIKSVTFTPDAPMRLWEVVQGTTTLKLRATDHAHALERASLRGVGHPESCRLVEG